VSLPVDLVVLSPALQGLFMFSPLAVADGFVADVLSSSHSSPVKDGWGAVESWSAKKENFDS